MTPAPADLADLANRIDPRVEERKATCDFTTGPTRETLIAASDALRHASEAAATARAVALEEAARIVDDKCAWILSRQDGLNDSVDMNIRLCAVMLPELATAIRALATPGHREAILERCARALSRRRYGSDAGFEEQGANAVAVLRAEADAVLKELGI